MQSLAFINILMYIKKMMLVKSTFHYVVIASEYNLVIEVMMAKK